MRSLRMTRFIALLGHSMATDILVRVAAERSDVGPIVLISAFSQEINASKPDELFVDRRCLGAGGCARLRGQVCKWLTQAQSRVKPH